MADAEAWHPERQHRRVAQTWALLATAATVVDVLQAGCAVGWTTVNPTPVRQRPATLQHKAVPAVGLAVMVVIVSAARGKLQKEKCIGTDRITEVGTDQDTEEPDTARHSSVPSPRRYLETDEVGGSEVPSEAVTGANVLTTHGALDCPAPAFWGDTQRSGWCSRGAAGPPNSWGGEARDSPQAAAGDTGDNIDPTARPCRAEAEGGGRLEAHESRCIFVNTGPKTIAVHLQAGHTLVGHVRDQVAAREGIATEHQRLMYAGEQLFKGDLTLEDYGVIENSTLHLLGRVQGGMPEASGDGSSSSKRPRLAFEDPMDIEAAGLDPLCAQWKVWLETCAPIATAFLPPEAKAAEALGYRERATRQGLTEAGMQEMVHWAAPGKPDHEVLVALAAYEKAKPYKVDLLQGKWVEAPKPPQGQPQDQMQNAPKVDPVQKEIADLEAHRAKLRMPKIPLCLEEQLKAVSDKAMQAGMESDLVAALHAYGATPMAGPEDAAKAGEVLRAAVWTTLYLTVTTRAPQPAPQPAPVATWTAMAHQLVIPVLQAAPQVPLQQVARTHPGPPRACFRCGMYGH